MAKKHNASIVILHTIEPISPRVYGEGSLKVEELLKEGKKRERLNDIEEIKKNLQEFCEEN